MSAEGTPMTTSSHQSAMRRRTASAVAIASVALLPLAVPAAAETVGVSSLSSDDALLDTVEEGATKTADTVQQVGNGTPVQTVTDPTSSTGKTTVRNTAGMLRQSSSPNSDPGPNPQPGSPGQPAPSTDTSVQEPSGSVDSATESTWSASGLRIDSATLLLARDATALPVVADVLLAPPTAHAIVAEPLARSGVPMRFAPEAATTSRRTQEVPAAPNLPEGVLAEALIAAALLVAATAALVAELGLKRSSPRTT